MSNEPPNDSHQRRCAICGGMVVCDDGYPADVTVVHPECVEEWSASTQRMD